MIVPQAIAYSILAGLPPIYGLYTSLVPIAVYALLGTSPQLAVGPSAMVALMVKGAIDGELGESDVTAEASVNIAIALSFSIGIMQMAFGLLRLGSVTNFISHDVLVGFTSGAVSAVTSRVLYCILSTVVAG
jgi:MFS superfamily sulfate permease-like transporter